MLIHLTRLTNERHRLEFVRDDGTRETHELETRSSLLHDLVHYAVETEAGLNASFYGRLASGKTYESLMKDQPEGPEAFQTEIVVVPQIITGIRFSDIPAARVRITVTMKLIEPAVFETANIIIPSA